MLPGRKVWPKSEERRAPVGMQLEHLHGVAEIKVKNLVGVEDVHFRESSRFKKVVNGRALGTRAAWQLDRLRRRVGSPEPTAFNGMWLQLQQTFDLVGSHRFRW